MLYREFTLCTRQYLYLLNEDLNPYLLVWFAAQTILSSTYYNKYDVIRLDGKMSIIDYHLLLYFVKGT